MSKPIILSILTPAVPSRLATYEHDESQLWHLQDKLHRQIVDQPVEHLIFCDNKRRTVGEKRDALLRMARGDYVAFVDDDDDVSDDYVAEILRAAEQKPDVITFNQLAEVNGGRSEIEFKLGNPNEAFQDSMGGQIRLVKRNAWHVCAWRRMLAQLSSFPASSYGEDWAFAAPLCAMPNLKEVHIPKILHFYRHSTETTEAPAPCQ